MRRLRQYADAVRLFIRNPAVPFTNNTAERAVRMPKVKQKNPAAFAQKVAPTTSPSSAHVSTPSTSRGIA